MTGPALTGEPPVPPPPPTPTAGGGSARKTRLIIAAVVVAALVIAGGVWAVAWGNRVDPVAVAARSVTLEPASGVGDDPFLEAVSIAEIAEFPDSVLAVVTATQNDMSIDPVTGTLTTGGTTSGLYGGRPPETTGLYGGSGSNTVCDPDALADYLDTQPAKAAAWAGAMDIPVGRIREHLAGLTAVTLLTDTLVTNVGFAGGAAIPRQSVLQAGTAVLVDPDGVPRVRCACGNPLAAPDLTDLATADVLGTRWAAYDPARTVTVTGGRATDDFTLVNVETGETFQQPVGPAASGAPDAVLAAVDGDIHRSADNGQTWTEVTSATDAGGYHTLAASEELIVAAGSTPYDYPAEPTGVITASTDGLTWTAPITLPDAIGDVAYGNGAFLALGNISDQTGGTGDQFAFAIYRSTDGAAWDRSVVTVDLEYAALSYATSLAHGEGDWLLEVASIVGEGAFRTVLTSTDGVSWTVAQQPDAQGPSGVSPSWNGERWGMVGSEVTGLKPENLDFILAEIGGSSADGLTWSTGPYQPAETALWSLTCAGSRGWLAIEGSFDMSAPITEPRVFSSPDLSTWTPWGSPLPAPGSDLLAVGPSSAPSPTTCAAPEFAAAAPPDAGVPSGDGSGERTSGDLGLPTPISSPSCDQGIGIVLLASATTPGSYDQDVQALLDRYPGSSYLRTDQSCSSLNQATADGNPIYAVYVVGGSDRDSVCAKVSQLQTDPGNGRWLANTAPSEARIDCGG